MLFHCSVIVPDFRILHCLFEEVGFEEVGGGGGGGVEGVGGLERLGAISKNFFF